MGHIRGVLGVRFESGCLCGFEFGGFERQVLIGDIGKASDQQAAVSLSATSAGPGHGPNALKIISVGDSYASGEGAKGSGWIDSNCHRSALAAPLQAASLLGALRPTHIDSLACSGSVIENGTDGAHQLLNSIDVAGRTVFGQMSQAGAPNDVVDALTISIGGNDLRFGDIVSACASPFDDCSTDPNVLAPLVNNLSALQYTRLDHLITATQGPVGFKQIPSTLRNVYLTEYPDPTTGPAGSRCGSSWAPTFGGFEGFSQTEAQWASQSFLAPLNGLLQAAVNKANDPSLYPAPHPVWHFVTGISAAFVGHGYCAPDAVRWINTPWDSQWSQGDTNGTIHPNGSGQQVIGSVLFSNLLLYPTVSSAATPVVQSPANLTVQAATADGRPVPQALVSMDGNPVGRTDQGGRLAINGWSFSSPGNHNVLVQSDSFPDAQTQLAVQGLAYQVTASPSPIPVGSTIPQLTIVARDQATNQLVNGTFTNASPGGGATTLRSGGTVTNALIRIGYTYQTEIGPNGKPVRLRVPVCPTHTFQPDLSVFQPGDFSSLIACS